MNTHPAADPAIGEMLRQTMRHWVTGVAIVTSRWEGDAHGMTVNSLVSVSLQPPLVTVTMAHNTRTYAMVRQSGIFSVTILSLAQQPLAERFAGRIPDVSDRLAGMDVFSMVTGAPLLVGGTAFLDCRVVYSYAMPLATLFVAEVVAVQPSPEEQPPLVYYNRAFTGL